MSTSAASETATIRDTSARRRSARSHSSIVSTRASWASRSNRARRRPGTSDTRCNLPVRDTSEACAPEVIIRTGRGWAGRVHRTIRTGEPNSLPAGLPGYRSDLGQHGHEVEVVPHVLDLAALDDEDLHAVEL